MLKGKRLLYLLAFLKLVLPFFLQNSYYQPHRDEFLYLAESQHMAWGYMEAPPLLSVFGWFTQLLGGGMFWLKLWPALFGALTFLLTGHIILSLKGNAFALLLGWLPFVIDGYIRLFFLFQPNFLEVFFWTLLAFSLLRYVQTYRNQWLYVFGVAAGFGLLSKYSVVFFTASLLVGLLLTRERKIYANKHLYLAGLLAVAIVLPNALWQLNHNFPLMHHMKLLREQQLQFISPFDFIKSQLIMNLPCLFTWLAAFGYMLSAKGRPYRFIGLGYLLVIALLAAMHGKDYYASGAYPVLFALGAVYIEALTLLRLKWVRYVLVTFSLALGLFSMPLLMPLSRPEVLSEYYEKTKLGPFTWEDHQPHPLPQDFADMIGWKEVTEKAARVLHSLPAEEQKQTFVYCRAYCFAGALNYYGHAYGLGEVYSDDASFLFWMPEKYNVKNLLMVGHHIPDKDDIVFQQFEKMTIEDSLVNPLARENGVRIFLFRNGNAQLNGMIEKGIAKMKQEFNR